MFEDLADNINQCNCARFITNLQTISIVLDWWIELSYPSKYEIESLNEFLATNPEIETLTIGKEVVHNRVCPRQQTSDDISQYFEGEQLRDWSKTPYGTHKFRQRKY